MSRRAFFDKMNFNFVVIFVLLQLQAASLRGIRSDKDQFYVDDDFEIAKPQNLGVDTPISSHQGNLMLEKVKPPSESVVPIDSSHQTVDQESMGNDKRRKFGNGRNNHYHPVNVTVEYVPGHENGTWNVEKKEKNLGKEILDSHPPTPCQVTTEELVATAQSTVTRALKGLCNAKDMEERFEDLESTLTTHLNTIKTMILNLEDRLGEHGDVVMYGQKQLSTTIAKGCSATNGNGGSQSSNTDLSNKNGKGNHDYPGSKSQSGINGVNEVDSDEDVSGTRDPEILKFNSSIHMETSLNGQPRKVFTYYWKIKDMGYKLKSLNPRKSFRSQSFYIFPSGYRMYLRVFPRQNEDKFYVRVGLTKGEFDDTLNWPFPLKHKIHILDQTKEGRLFEDIASRIWDPNLLCSDFNWQKPIKGDNHECVEIGFPHDVLKQREYIRKDALVIKLTVYLES